MDAGFRNSLEIITEQERQLRQLRELTHYALLKREVYKIWLTIISLLCKAYTLISGSGLRRHFPSVKLENQPNKILCLLPVLDWSLGDIRIKNPLEELVRTKGGELQRRFIYKYTIHELQNADIIFLQREADNFTLELIKEAKELGKYIIFDAVTGNLLKLDFKDLHIGIVKKGDFYISCADFVDDNENKYDIDFLVAEKNGGFTVFQSIVHSVNGEKRIYHVGDMPDK